MLTDTAARVAALQSQAGADAGAGRRRAHAARQRASAERAARRQAAHAERKAMRRVNAGQPKCRRKGPADLRASTAAPECRPMTMPDGGFRPAYNVQFATATAGGVIVGVDVTNQGADGGFATVGAIGEAERGGTAVDAPPKKDQEHLAADRDPYARKKSDTDATARWRARMGAAAAKAIYTERASTAAGVTARARNRGPYAVPVRGPAEVLAVVLWYAVAHTFARMTTLRAAVRVGGARRADAGAA